MKHKITTPCLQNIVITDELIGHYTDIVADKLLDYQWRILNDKVEDAEKSYVVDNFRKAAGEKQGKHQGAIFCDTDAYKWLETVAYCLASGRAKQFEPIADELIELIGRAQQPDGYLNTYFTLSYPEEKWKNLAEGHELYGAGHLIEAAVAYYSATGKEALLQIACKMADLICQVFGEGGLEGYPGHQEIELALVKLYRTTGEEKYLDMAEHFIKVRGEKPNYLMKEMRAPGKRRIFPEFVDYDERYAQSHDVPVKQTSAEGHAVRAVYMYSAMADIARECQDEEMAEACKVLWNNVTGKRMYITGGIGSSGYLERFTTDYDLPNDRMYCESCASVGLMMFGQRMNVLTGEAEYYDVVEKALHNTVLAGISAEGDRYFYVNPLEVWPDNCIPGTSMQHVKPVRQPWFACACCPPNIARTLASIGQYIYAQDEKGIYINQFISSTLNTEIPRGSLQLGMKADPVKKGKVVFDIDAKVESPFVIRIRIPGYFRKITFTMDGKPITPALEKGYAVVAVSKDGHQTLEMQGEVNPCWLTANENVRSDIGRIALSYGPYVYCLEETDNGRLLSNIYVDPKEQVEVQQEKNNLPGNLPVLRFKSKRLHTGVKNLYGEPDFWMEECESKAVPYCLWGNRENGEMTVWVNAVL